MALLTMGVFAGCGNDDAAATNTSSTTSSTEEDSSATPESDTAANEASDSEQAKDTAANDNSKSEQNTTVDTSAATHSLNADIIGAVTLSDGNTLTVDVYEPHTSDVDLLTIAGSDLTETGASEMIELGDVVNIKEVVDGSLVASSADVISEGDVVAVVTNEDGTKDLLILDLNN